MEPILLVFLKAPVPRLVKTRLAAAIGSGEAAREYRLMAGRVRDAVRGLTGVKVVWVYAAHRLFPGLGWLGLGRTPFWPQGRGDLGARMSRAFARAFRETPGPVCAIGTDSPWLKASRLRGAFRALRACDAVVGPTEDGGYYLLGMRCWRPSLLHAVPWSTDRTLEETLLRAKALRLKVSRLPKGYDVDDAAGWSRWRRTLSPRASRFR